MWGREQGRYWVRRKSLIVGNNSDRMEGYLKHGFGRKMACSKFWARQEFIVHKTQLPAGLRFNAEVRNSGSLGLEEEFGTLP